MAQQAGATLTFDPDSVVEGVADLVSEAVAAEQGRSSLVGSLLWA